MESVVAKIGLFIWVAALFGWHFVAIFIDGLPANTLYLEPLLLLFVVVYQPQFVKSVCQKAGISWWASRFMVFAAFVFGLIVSGLLSIMINGFDGTQ